MYAGLAFEHFVHDHAHIVSEKAGYKDQIKHIGSYWQRPTKRKTGVQIDVLIECHGNTTLVCECKWSGKKTGLSAVNQLRKQLKAYPNKNQHTLIPVLLSAGGVAQAVKKEKDIVVITIDDFIR